MRANKQDLCPKSIHPSSRDVQQYCYTTAAHCTTGFFLSLSLDIDLPLLQHYQQKIFMFKKVNIVVRLQARTDLNFWFFFDPALVPFWSLFGPFLVPLWSLSVPSLDPLRFFLSFFCPSLYLAMYRHFSLQEISCNMKITKSTLLDSIVDPSISLNKCERLDNLHLYKHQAMCS